MFRDAVTDVFFLRWIGIKLLQHGGVRSHEGEVFSFRRQHEIGVQLASRDRPVFPGSEHLQPAAACQRNSRKLPFQESCPVITQGVVLQVHRIWSGIVDFDPVRKSPILIGEHGGIVRHEFTNARRGSPQGGR